MDFRDPLHVVGFLIAVPGGIAWAVYLPVLVMRRMRTAEWRQEAPAERVLAIVGALAFEAFFLLVVAFGIWRAFIMK